MIIFYWKLEGPFMYTFCYFTLLLWFTKLIYILGFYKTISNQQLPVGNRQLAILLVADCWGNCKYRNIAGCWLQGGLLNRQYCWLLVARGVKNPAILPIAGCMTVIKYCNIAGCWLHALFKANLCDRKLQYKKLLKVSIRVNT